VSQWAKVKAMREDALHCIAVQCIALGMHCTEQSAQSRTQTKQSRRQKAESRKQKAEGRSLGRALHRRAQLSNWFARTRQQSAALIGLRRFSFSLFSSRVIRRAHWRASTQLEPLFFGSTRRLHLAAGCWLLAAGCWRLPIGHWRALFGDSPLGQRARGAHLLISSSLLAAQLEPHAPSESDERQPVVGELKLGRASWKASELESESESWKARKPD